jgi:hypothetical protein
MSVSVFKSDIPLPITSGLQVNFSHNINKIYSFIKSKYIVDQEIKCEEGINPSYYSFTMFSPTPSAHTIFLYNNNDRLTLRVTTFHPIRFASSYNVYLSDINKKVKKASSDFYENQIDIYQYNSRKEFIADKLAENIKKRFGDFVLLDVDDHIQGDPVHLVMDFTVLSEEKFSVLDGILLSTRLAQSD